MTSRVFVIRAAVAVAAVLCLAAHRLGGWTAAEWFGLAWYCICLGMYAKALFIALARMKRVTADLLVVTVMVVSLAAGQPLGGALVAGFISLGLAISFAIIEKTRRRIESLVSQRRKMVRIVRDGRLMNLPVEAVCRGDVAVVAQGESIPVDGQIVAGTAPVDESVITGEPLAVQKQIGDTVISGSINLGPSLRVLAEKDGDQGFVYAMAREIKAALERKPRTQRTADTIVQFFICGVVSYAAGVFFFYGGLSGNTDAALVRMAAVTAVACPCAWALSVPTAFAAAIGGLSAGGILVRGGEPLERAGRIKNVVLDKTGTLTLGRPTVTRVATFGMPEEELLRIAASVEVGFRHPVADAVVAYAAARQIRPLPADKAEYLPALGVRSIVQGRQVVLGSTETMKALGNRLPGNFTPGGSVTWIAIDGQVAGAFVIRDTLNEDTRDLGAVLRTLGVHHVALATGDNEKGEAQRVADAIGANEVCWGLKPQDKTAIVQRLGAQGTTAMVGDGVNDALSLAAADVGISVARADADLAVQSSDIIVLHGDAARLPVIIDAGRRLDRVIRQNYAWAIAFNTVGIALATAGLLSPWLAALFHHLSSVLVVANSARLARIGRPTPAGP